MRKTLLFAALVPVLAALSAGLVVTDTHAQDPSGPVPDESVLGTIDVNGSAGGVVLPPLPKLAVLPLLTQGVAADSLVQLVVRRDLELSGQFDVVDASVTPPGLLTRDAPIDWSAWDKTHVEFIVRVYAVGAPNAANVELVAEAFLAPPKPKPGDKAEKKDKDAPPEPPPPPPKPVYTKRLPSLATEVRPNAHKLVDDLLGGLTGRPGGFSSHMIYAGRVGRWSQVFTLDSDGFALKGIGPNTHTVLSPAFGPNDEVFYSISENFFRFKLAHGEKISAVPMEIPGALLSFAFSPDRKDLAIGVMKDGVGTVYTGSPTGSAWKPISKEPLAGNPAFGPGGKIAYIAGQYATRVYVDGKPVSPAGFLASAPAFCDTPQGLYVLLTVGVGAGRDVIAVDVSSGQIRRLTQNMGSNSYAACSPDGRLVAYFSNRGLKGPGLYVAPILRPGLAKKISDQVGEGLRWEPLLQPRK